MNKVLIYGLVMWMFLMGCQAEPNSFPASYYGGFIDTRWAYHFRDDGTFTLELNGHITVDTIDGEYRQARDTMWLSTTDSIDQANFFDRNFFLLQGDTALLDFQHGFSFAKEGFSPNFLPGQYPETYPVVFKGSLEDKRDVRLILEEIFKLDELKAFLAENKDTVVLAGDFLDLSDPVSSLNETFKGKYPPFKWDSLYRVRRKGDFISFYAIRYDSESAWVWLELNQDKKPTYFLLQFRKHNGGWYKVAIR